jgi:hypothetical protein
MRRRIGFACSAIAFVALVARATGCTSSNESGPADCVAAGGQCQIPNDQCAKVGPQDCNPGRTLGGQYCCLAETDDGPGQGATDAASGDTSDDGGTTVPCNGGCLCNAANACPTGCYVSQTAQADGSSSEPFCGNGIAECGGAWSFGDTKSCPGLNPPGSRTALPDYPVSYLDGGPDGAFCCDLEHEYALIGDAAADTGGPDAADGTRPADASTE